MSADAVCVRFVRAIGGASAVAAAPSDRIAVELRFLSQGIAIADTAGFRAGKAEHRQRFELAVTDRAFQPSDIDRLAASVATDMLNRR